MTTTELPEWAIREARDIARKYVHSGGHVAEAIALALVSAHAAGRVAGLEEAMARLDIPEVNDFIEGARREAIHQRVRWGSDHDEGKTDADWFWLIGYLAGKALHKPEKRLHHLVTTAAALANWHAFTLGKTTMRPGIAHPTPNADSGTEQEK